MEFHDDYPQYEMMAHHSEADGKKKRRTLWNVFWIMLAITLVELYIGMNAAKWHLVHTLTLKFIFIGLTIVKAFYIVYKFMHLGDERPAAKWTIIAPYGLFILYLVWICITEATYNGGRKGYTDPNVTTQLKKQLDEIMSGGGHHEDAGASHEKHEEPHH